MQTTGRKTDGHHTTSEWNDRPRFRQDLVAEQIDEAGGRFIDVMDPDSGNLFRFFEVEYSLACAMDGERDVPGIVRWAQEELGLTPSPAEVKTVIATLGSLGYLQTAAAAAMATTLVDVAVSDEATMVGTAPIDEELAPGILVGKRQDTAVDNSVELGQTNMASAAKGPEMPVAPDYGLGAPGSSTVMPKPPAIPVEDVTLGASGAGEAAADEAIPQAGDMSLDLSDHLAIRPDDVKEAVRASRVMSSVELPKDLLDAIEPEPEKKPVEAAKPVAAAVKPVAAKPVEAVKPVAAKPVTAKVEKPVEKPAAQKPAAAKPVSQKVEKQPVKPAVELPKTPVVEKPKHPPVAQRSGVSGMTVILLILLVLTAGGFFAWKYLLNNPDDETETETSPKHRKPVAKVTPQAEPAPIAGKIALKSPPSQDLTSLTAGAVETSEANDKMVKAGDVIVRLAGAKQLETELAALQKEIDSRVKPELDKATADLTAATTANNKDAMAKAQAIVTERQKSLDDKQGKVATKTAELEKFVIKAPTDGQLSAVAKLAPMPVLAVVLKAPALTANTPVTLAIKNSDKKLSCTVVSVDGDNAKVTCPAEPAVSDNTDVLLVK